MTAANFRTENSTFRKLFGNGLRYRVPRFQRDYSWDEEQWSDLWEDVVAVLDGTEADAHYMGYLVLQSANDKEFEIIDGQQRITSITLLVLAAMKLLQGMVERGADADHAQRRLEQLRGTYIGYLDPVTLVVQPKLTLNRNNEAYFRRYVAALAPNLPRYRFSETEHRLRQAFEWFARRVHGRLAQMADPGRAVAEFVERLSDRLFFTVITVGDDLNAYKVFETLNARGVQLSPTDLVKNYLFSTLDRDSSTAHDLTELGDHWEAVIGRLGAERFPDFLRGHWNSRREFVRSRELYGAVRREVRDRRGVFAFLRDVDEDLDTYLALTVGEAGDWPSEWRRMAALPQSFNVRQHIPLVLAGRRRYDDEDFGELLRAILVISVRYNVIGNLPPNEQEVVYTRVARALAHSPQEIPLRECLRQLRPVYPSDTVFRASFAEKTLRTTQTRNARIAKYLLREIERHAGGAEIDEALPGVTLEHILPQRPRNAWPGIPEQDHDALVFRLGNLTLLESSLNHRAGDASFADKVTLYAESAYTLTSKLATEPADWSVERIAARQRWMAHQATAIWRLPQLAEG